SMAAFLLAVDVGNTATGFCLFKIDSPLPIPLPIGIVSTSSLGQARSLKAILGRGLRRLGVPQKGVHAVYISSVVPTVDAAVGRLCRQLTGQPPVFVSAKTPSLVRIKYRVPSEVGADRIVNARAAMALSPQRPAIVVDFGTATTFDCVTGRGEYLGGVIAPGP